MSARSSKLHQASPPGARPPLYCAIYTRVSTDHGLDQELNSFDNQREAAEVYVRSQAHEGWRLLHGHYDDGGFSGGSLERPALQRLLAEVRARRLDVIVVYKVDRLTRALSDFAKLVELFDGHGVSFVSVTQAFNTTTSMGRLTLNVLLSFAQFEREVTGERIRDKIAASKRKGLWMGGVVPLGYLVEGRALHVVEEHAALVRAIFAGYLVLGTVAALKQDLDARGITLPVRRDGAGRGGRPVGVRSRAGICTSCSAIPSTSDSSDTKGRSMRASSPPSSTGRRGRRCRIGSPPTTIGNTAAELRAHISSPGAFARRGVGRWCRATRRKARCATVTTSPGRSKRTASGCAWPPRRSRRQSWRVCAASLYRARHQSMMLP